MANISKFKDKKTGEVYDLGPKTWEITLTEEQYDELKEGQFVSVDGFTGEIGIDDEIIMNFPDATYDKACQHFHVSMYAHSTDNDVTVIQSEVSVLPDMSAGIYGFIVEKTSTGEKRVSVTAMPLSM